MPVIRAAILTISDTASLDQSADTSGPTIIEILQTKGIEIQERHILPDDECQIRQLVKDWCMRGDIDLVLTTGGTGFGVRDRTPEAIEPLLERHASGLVHLLLATSLQHTPLAALSRPVAGTYKNTLIVTLPGSVKAVKENVNALLTGGVLGHALELIKGESGQRVHAALSASPSQPHVHATLSSINQHSHQHHQHDHDHIEPKPRTILSHDPSLPVSARHRSSLYTLFSFEEAISSILGSLESLEVSKQLVTPSLAGHILAEDVYAPQNVPSTYTTSIDGYALKSTDPPGVYKVLTSQMHDTSHPLPEGCIYRVNTGGPLPAGADTTIMVEDTSLHSTFPDSHEEKEVETLVQVPPGENVRAPGSDVKKGDLVLQKGELLKSIGGEVGTLAFVGRKEVKVYRKPIVALLSTGNEIVDLHSTSPKTFEDGWGGIWDTNRPSLQAALRGMGYQVLDLGIVLDDVQAHVDALRKGLDEADIILTTGGTSMGSSDLLKPVIERHFNGTIHFGRVTIKPGKPTTFATVPTGNGARSKPIFALPGNPASALVTYHIFVVPALRKLGGWPETECQLPRVSVQLQDEMRLDPRMEFHRVILKAGKQGLKAYSTGGQRSSRVASLNGANGLVILPPKVKGGAGKLAAGVSAEAMVIGEIQMY